MIEVLVCAGLAVLSAVLCIYSVYMVRQYSRIIRYLLRREEQLTRELGRIGVEVSLIMNRIRKLEERAQ